LFDVLTTSHADDGGDVVPIPTPPYPQLMCWTRKKHPMKVAGWRLVVCGAVKKAITCSLLLPSFPETVV
jgi:hypothetical protein